MAEVYRSEMEDAGMMIERPAQISAEIRTLLANGSVKDLTTERGKLLRMFFTMPEEEASRGLPMDAETCANFDGRICDACRGMTRFSQCPMCHGELPDPAHNEAVAEATKKNEIEGAARAKALRASQRQPFFSRISRAWTIITGNEDNDDEEKED